VAGAGKEEWDPLLPLGFHDLDPADRHRLCVDRFPDSVTRPRILTNLEDVIARINHQGIGGQIWIDGSFLTEKLNPDDADVALVVTGTELRGMSGSQRRFFDDFRGRSLYDRYRIDNYGIAIDLGTVQGDYFYAYWLRQFGFSRASKPKGILRISVPFLVTP
jgi:Family of unknown function (DUF6932)